MAMEHERRCVVSIRCLLIEFAVVGLVYRCAMLLWGSCGYLGWLGIGFIGIDGVFDRVIIHL